MWDFKFNRNQDSTASSYAKSGERDDFLSVERLTWIKVGPPPGLDVIQDIPSKVLSGHQNRS